MIGHKYRSGSDEAIGSQRILYFVAEGGELGTTDVQLGTTFFAYGGSANIGQTQSSVHLEIGGQLQTLHKNRRKLDQNP